MKNANNGCEPHYIVENDTDLRPLLRGWDFSEVHICLFLLLDESLQG